MKTSEIINNDLQQLIARSQAVGNQMAASPTLRYQLHVPRGNKGALRENAKPQAALWTSTAIRVGDSYTSEWVQWCQQNMPDWVGPRGLLYQVRPGALVLNITNDAAAMKIARLFGRNYQGDDIDRLRNYPWAEIGQVVDAVRYPQRTGRWNDLLMNMWDVESTAWYNRDHLELVGQVSISAG